MNKIGVIGCGHWGPNHIRVFSHLEDCQVLMAADTDQNRLKNIKKLFPSITTTPDYRNILKNNDIDAVIVATPITTHYKIVKDCLEHGKDVLCEKPLTVSGKESEELVALAGKQSRILMVGHVFLFNSGIQELKRLITEGELGKVYYMHSKRTNLGPIREDVNAVYDLASHDVSIFSYLLNLPPEGLVAKGEAFLQNDIEDVAFITISYPEKILGNIYVSWLDPQKVRQITVVGDKKMAVWDDLNNFEPIRIYNKGVVKEPYYDDFGQFQLLLRDSEILIPKIKMGEPLKIQNQHFLESIRNRKKPLSDGSSALEVVRTLEAIQKSLKASSRISL